MHTDLKKPVVAVQNAARNPILKEADGLKYREMFTKIARTDHAPESKPVLIWDGECGFCKYWVINLKQRTGDNIAFRTYQEAASDFPGIPLKEFEKASRLIEPDGRVYSGPDSLYRSLDHANQGTWPWHRWYERYGWFARVNDYGYNFIAKNRPFMFEQTKALFGNDIKKLKPFWLGYLLLFVGLIFLMTQIPRWVGQV